MMKFPRPSRKKFAKRKQPGRHNTFRIAVNILCSLALVLSSLALTGMLALGLHPFEQGEQDNPSEAPGAFEPLPVSTHHNSSYILVVGTDNSAGLTDVILVACIDHEKDTMSMLQITRDLYIGGDIPSGKVNAVYANAREGESHINALRRRLGSYLGIPIDHYVTFNLENFRHMVDAIGGVDINVTQERGIDVEDFTTGKHYIMGPGPVHLDGHKAESFVRKRYQTKHMDPGYALGDVSRVQQQRVFYAALAMKLKNMSMGQVTKVAATCYNEITTDLSVGELLGYAKEIKQVSLENVVMKSVPGQFCETKLSGQDYRLDYYSIHKKQYVEMFNEFFNPYGEPISADSIKIKELHTLVGDKYEPSVANNGGTLQQIADDNAK
ncbi:MAG: LCP family protein [Clostridiales bacterium]|nr:LCP family protein [Clostridiales bacterium]